MQVDTAKATGRRDVHYRSFEELVADGESLQAGPVRVVGNWSAGQVFQHLAKAFNGSVDGFPTTFPWYVRVVARLFKKRLLGGSMPPGMRLPGKLAEQLVPEPTSQESGWANLRAAAARLEREPRRARHPALGALSKAEWEKIHLAHASLHMSFLWPCPAGQE
jgi:hypothetical protein